MKTIKLSLLLFATVGLMAACDKEVVETYDPSYSAVNIGFGNATSLTQEMTYNFSEASGERGVKFFARISGVPSDHDRSFTLEAVDGDLTKTAGTYRVETYTIPAGEISGEFTLYFDSSKLPSGSFIDEDGLLVFRVAENKEFNPGSKNANELRFTLKNYLSKPEEWDAAVYPYQPIMRYFGEYSEVKFRFMIENGFPSNIRVNWSQTEPIIVEGATTIISVNYANYLKQVYQIALNEYNNSHDTPLQDSFGNPIYF